MAGTMQAMSAPAVSARASSSAASHARAARSVACFASTLNRRGGAVVAPGGLHGRQQKAGRSLAAVVRAEDENTSVYRELTDYEKARSSKGLAKQFEIGQGGMWLSSTTRHVHIYAGVLVNDDYDQSQLDKLTIDVDPDCEFVWTDEPLQKVFNKFDECVASHKGAPLNDYTLRLIGSDVEHFIRGLLQAGEIQYNLKHRAINYSMGRPRLEGLQEAAEAAEA